MYDFESDYIRAVGICIDLWGNNSITTDQFCDAMDLSENISDEKITYNEFIKKVEIDAFKSFMLM